MRDVPPLSQPHAWGRGQRLDRQDRDEAGGDAAAVGGIDLGPVVSRAVGSLSHQWPSDGVRLRPSDQSNESGTPGSESAEPDPPNLRARMAAELRQESPEKVPSVSRGVRVSPIPSLRHLALQEAIILINAPSMQYSRSLSGMTPELAELIVDHMIKERVLRPRALELFTGCPIRSLTLNCYPYCTNDLLRHLRGFTNIRKLSLSSCTLITDQGVSVVRFLHKLQYLNVSSCRKLTDSCLPFLLGLEHLSHLVLDQTKVSDDGLCDFLLQSCGSLTHLSVNQTSVTERTISLLSQRVPELKLLSIKHTQVSDVSSLHELKQLNSLHLDNTQVTEPSLLAAASLSRLSTLTLSGVQSLTSDRVLELVSGLPLTRLVLPGRRCLTDDGLSNLGGLRSLVELNLMDHTHITDQGVQHISLLTRLQILSLCNTSVSDAGLLHLRGLRHLEELSLDRTKVTSRGVSQCVPHLPHLQVLGLSSTAVGDNVLKHGIRHCRALLKVNLSRTRVTDKGLRLLKAVSIVQLNLDGTGVSLQGVSDLMASCVSILSVRANNLRQIPRVDVSDEE
uniref:F-box/LRR-repeat protein 14 n=1 Tax=Leptobrachium leishanense TaxID=445787 RepID=A0A8C5QDR3_9ANUR